MWLHCCDESSVLIKYLCFLPLLTTYCFLTIWCQQHISWAQCIPHGSKEQAIQISIFLYSRSIMLDRIQRVPDAKSSTLGHYMFLWLQFPLCQKNKTKQNKLIIFILLPYFQPWKIQHDCDIVCSMMVDNLCVHKIILCEKMNLLYLLLSFFSAIELPVS